MSVVYPGIHPAFKMDTFDVEEQRVLRRFAELFHLTSFGSLELGATSKYRYALIKPSSAVSGIVHTERELVLLFSSYSEFQPRTLDAFDRIIHKSSDEFRIEKVVRILISNDGDVSKKLKALFKSTPDAPVVVPFSYDEAGQKLTDQGFHTRVKEFTFSRDLFSMSSPLRGDLYFYGRANLINEMVAKLSSGENFGLFGLRRSGKTSIINGIHRTLRSRDLTSYIIDCQNPSIHKRRWNDLLYHITRQIKEYHAISVNLRNEGRYDEIGASDSFFSDMCSLKSKLRTEKIALLFDEFERIAIGTASSAHWNEEDDFLSFWQALRYGFQSERSPFTYLLVGTNPRAIEATKILGSDNPLFGNVEKRFIPMFDFDTVTQMVHDLGRIMGVNFGPEVCARLVEDFGGHPFLTRYACSYISKVRRERPLAIDRTLYEEGVISFAQESNQYVGSVVELLKEQYPEEFEMLKLLAEGNYGDFSYYAAEDPKMAQHVIGYGLVESGSAAHYFRVGVVQKYFENLSKSPSVLTQEARREEIGTRVSRVEMLARDRIRMVFQVAFHPNERKRKLLDKVSKDRIDRFDEYSFEALLSSASCPLYFSELREIILNNWTQFGNVLGIEKSEFDHYARTVNEARRLPSHAKDVGDDEFQRARVALRELEKALGD